MISALWLILFLPLSAAFGFILCACLRMWKESEIKEQEPCKYCNGATTEYQNTPSTKISISTFGSASTLLVESNYCPPYANCAMKDIVSRSSFIINYCPQCGRKMEAMK